MRAAAVAVLVLVLALPAAAAQPRRATLKLATLVPLVAHGQHFGKRERVVLTASSSNARRMLSVVARRDGAFTARFDLRLGGCASLTVRAVGARGSRATLQLEPGCDKKKPRGAAG
jgi:hypothetical protein